ncbi:hypothetical protein GQ55_3G160800 [Panicum hallii var. hallii]|uniref:Uncharacterized protein n=1 Tax=Panicum hallii var. hallii TaxID=1504633 RepID=A0A2T7EA02_9POAL|nr:hypothetical protein GQ55_3G160800 [Panicum hallii var. hallii]PUZ64664.1 hypothetical protein GQ55_3G160800 [Panicum hallii var. hallii]
MASLVSRPRHSIQTYWARRNYQRLGSPSRRLRVARLGAGGSSRAASTQPAPAAGPASARSSSWKARASRAARVRAAVVLAAPALLLARLRDAYVDAMVALGGGAVRPCAALARSRRGAEAGLWAKRVPRARGQPGQRSGGARGGDFERRMMAHIYSMVVTPELPCAARA